MGCKVTDIVALRTSAGTPADGWLVLGEVVAVYIDKALIHDGIYQTSLARPIMRAGRGGDYFAVTEAAMFQMMRPSGSGSPEHHGS
jgi:hypothetical protein